MKIKPIILLLVAFSLFFAYLRTELFKFALNYWIRLLTIVIAHDNAKSLQVLVMGKLLNKKIK